MESIAALSVTPDAKPLITREQGINLAPAHEKLLEQHFSNRKNVHVEREFHSGYSGSTPYLISFPTGSYKPVVAKFDHPVILKREWDAYVNIVKGRLSIIAPDQSGLIQSEDGGLGLLVYSYVGSNIDHLQSLDSYITTQGGNAAVNVLNRILDDLGKTSSDHSPHPRITRQKYYDRLLPPYLHLTAMPAPMGEVSSLKAGEIEESQLVALKVGQMVYLEGFRVHKVTGDQLTLYADLPAKVEGAPIRVKLNGIYAAPGAALPAQYAVITATRNDLLDGLIRETLPTFNRYTECFTEYGCTFPNPLRHLQALLDGRDEAKVAIIHGDFHLQNILVDKFGTPWLIDFAKTGYGPTLFDLQYLEARILTTLLCDSKMSMQKRVRQLKLVFEALGHETLPAMEALLSPKVPAGVNRDPYIVLVGLRRLARHYLVKQSDWAEYYRGLTLALLQLLKFDDFKAVRLLALIGAATTLQWTGIKDVKPVQAATRPWLFWATSGILATLLVLSVCAWYQFPLLLHNLFSGQPAYSIDAVGAAPVPVYFPLATPVSGCDRAVTDVIAQKLPPKPTGDRSMLQRVKARGVLLCGVEGTLPHFSYVRDQREIKGLPGFYADVSGLDADFCRVIATSVFGDYRGRVAFTKLDPQARFTALISDTVDVLIRNTTWTAGRDIGLGATPKGIDFNPVIFYDGQRFMVHTNEDPPINTLADLKNKKICIQSATTTVTNTLVLSNELGLNLQIIDPYLTTQEVVDAYNSKQVCDVMTGDTSQLVSRLDIMSEDNKIIPTNPISFEPLAPAVLDKDSQWRDIVNYAIWITIYAEEIGATQANIDKNLMPIHQQFLNTGNKMEKNLGLSKDFAKNIIKQIGNYGEIYACNLTDKQGNAVLERGQNQPALWYNAKDNTWLSNPAGGLLISPPLVP